MSDKPILPGPDGIEPILLRDALEERYLAYALSTIMHRALPDVRDGLKPVHRRILYAMRELKLDPAAGYKKCAKVVGEVMGSYHPHGDQAIYDALVRLAQSFAVRYPLVDGQGNFGNVDGDNAAAMRYTESRLTEVAQALLDGIDEDTVEFRATYDGTMSEPVVLPAAFPNLLANGSSGIAVGMATNIPPHNAEELCTALLHLIKHPNARVESLVEMSPGRTSPPAACWSSRASPCSRPTRRAAAASACAPSGQEDTGRGTYQIVVTEIPYQVKKAKLIEQIAELLIEKKLPLLGDVNDEFGRGHPPGAGAQAPHRRAGAAHGEPVPPTELETRFRLNMNVLRRGGAAGDGVARGAAPWLDHRLDVLVRRTHRLRKIEQRLEIFDGYLIAYLNLDEVIRIVRFEDEPKAKLIAAFKLAEIQAEAILNHALASLSKLEEMEIRPSTTSSPRSGAN